jgi:hypothetical protein
MIALPTQNTAPATERSLLGVFYDPATGAIAHVHMTAVEGDTPLPNAAAFEAEAHDYLKRYVSTRKTLPAKLSFLHVEPQHYQFGRRYHVDVKKLALVETPKAG